MTPEKKKVDIERNYSDETFYTDSSEDVRSKCKSAANLLQKRRQLRPINGSGNPYRSNTRLTSFTSPSKSNVSMITQKIMSAKLLRMKQLQNELTDAQFQLNELSTENRILRTLQKRQDMALKKYEGTQAELPQLIRSHTEEVRTLKSKLKQVKTQCREVENHLKMRETELSALQEQHKHLLKLSKDKHLSEREQLQLQLEQTQQLLKEQDKKIQMLSRKVMLESKNFKHQLTSEVTRHKRTTKELDLALDRIAQLETILEAKEKYIAVNLTRTLGNQPSSLMALVPQARLQLYPTPSQTATSRNLPSKVTIAHTDLKKLVKAEETIGEESVVLAQLDKKHLDMKRLEAPLKHALHRQKAHVRLNEEEEEDVEDDTDDDYQPPLLSESVESQSYASQNTLSRSMENIYKDSKDVRKENETRRDFSSRTQSEFKLPAAQCPEEVEALQTGSKSSKKRYPLRRYSVSGDSDLIANDLIAKSSRRGSLNGAGDSDKKELAFVPNLISETDKTAMQTNVLDKYSSYNMGTAMSGKFSFGPATMTTNQIPVEPVFSSNEYPNANDNIESKCEDAVGNALEIPPCDMTAEEGQLHLQAINSTWNEIQTRIRDETIRAQSVIEKYDEEHRNVDAQAAIQAAVPEAYDKNHLLAALRAIEDGGDPIELNDEIHERRSQLSIRKPRTGEYRKVSQAVENLHRGIPIHATSSVTTMERPQKEHPNFWENDSIMSPHFLGNEMEGPRQKSDIMHNIFGNEK